MEQKKSYQLLDKKTLNKSYIRWMMYNLVATSFEFLEAFGFALSMEPIAKKIYKDNPEAQKAMLKRHSVFYNTEPQIGSLINGVVVGLEEQRALGKEEIDDDFVNGLKVGLMGPLAGIGDSMIPGMLIPILLSIGMGLSEKGSILGPIFYIVAYNTIIMLGSRFLFFKGYELGAESVDTFVGEKAQQITQAFSVLGMIVIGGVAASYVNLKLPIVLKFSSAKIDRWYFPKSIAVSFGLSFMVLDGKKRRFCLKTNRNLFYCSLWRCRDRLFDPNDVLNII